jgi:hypothetical protein
MMSEIERPYTAKKFTDKEKAPCYFLVLWLIPLCLVFTKLVSVHLAKVKIDNNNLNKYSMSKIIIKWYNDREDDGPNLNKAGSLVFPTYQKFWIFKNELNPLINELQTCTNSIPLVFSMYILQMHSKKCKL